MPTWQGAQPGRLFITLAVGALIWALPPPVTVAPQAWHLLAIFVATIVGIIVRPLPMGAVAMLGIAATVVTGTLRIGEALSGFANSTVWLIATAFFISRGFIKTGLGRRAAYTFMALFGKRTMGLGYSLVAADLVLAPVTPSNTARAGGVVFPILQSVAITAFGPADNPRARQTGAFLTLVAYQGTVITSAMFITAMAANPLAVELARQQNIAITWGTWAIAALAPGVVSLVLVPLLIYRLCPPGIRESPDAQVVARAELARMGPMQRAEGILLGILVVLLTLWIFGPMIGVDATAAALAGLGLLLLSGVLVWDDVCREHEAWNTLVWFASLVMMATFLGQLGFIGWFSKEVGGAIGETGWVTGFLVLSLVYFYSHYLFASNTAHVSAMFAPFLTVAVSLGTPPLLAALVLGFFSNLFASLTHYATGPSPIFFGSGYVSLGTWWMVGAVVSVVNIVIWLGVGGMWWKLLGLW